MEKALRSIMFIFRQHSESALFASDLRFHISGLTTDDISSTFKYLKPSSFGGQKPEEALSILNMKLHVLIDEYRFKLEELINRAKNNQ